MAKLVDVECLALIQKVISGPRDVISSFPSNPLYCFYQEGIKGVVELIGCNLNV